MRQISEEVYAALKDRIDELEKIEREKHFALVIELSDGTERKYDKLYKAKQAISNRFTQDVLFVSFGKYIVAEYYFKPIALIVLAED